MGGRGRGHEGHYRVGVWATREGPGRAGACRDRAGEERRGWRGSQSRAQSPWRVTGAKPGGGRVQGGRLGGSGGLSSPASPHHGTSMAGAAAGMAWGPTEEGNIDSPGPGRAGDGDSGDDPEGALRADEELLQVIARVVLTQGTQAVQHGAIGQHL